MLFAGWEVRIVKNCTDGPIRTDPKPSNNLFLFPVDCDTHERNVFGAASLFQTDHNMIISSRGKLTGRFASTKNHSEFVLAIFYLQLINSGHADSSMADKNHAEVSQS